ncbi:phage tail protein, partial [Providencia stuartii]
GGSSGAGMTLQIQGNTSKLLAYRQRNEGSWSSWFEIYSTGNTTKDHNGNLKVSGSSSELSDYPVGAPIPWPQSTVPAGYLICNGQAFNKTTYPLLAKAYPSGVLPDLRGEFIRGLDAGRNIDSNRTVLSPQGDAIRNITGEFGNNGLANRNSDWSGQASGAFSRNRGGICSNREVDYAGCTYTFDASRVVPTANENRPRNIAFLYIVRAA